jgi:tRNA1(Val) A37 N6-methylase TrmN6
MGFTYEYSQPSEYRFSLDSVLMAETVAGLIRVRSDLSGIRVMDLCSGCGVVGFELSWHLRELRKMDFVEVQEVYQSHFMENVKTVDRAEMEFRFHLLNYEQLRTPAWREQVDLVVCNPPYFRVGQGKLSPSEFKNRCRFYIDSDFQNLVDSLLWVLKPRASAYVLLRPLQDHAWDMMQELENRIAERARAVKVADIRGTDLIQLERF